MPFTFWRVFNFSLGRLSSPNLNHVNIFLFEKFYDCDNLFDLIVYYAAPSRAPDMVIAQNSSSTSLLVRWNNLPKEHFQGQPIGYIITYHTVDLKSNMNAVRENFPTNSTTLTNLTIYTMYVINVSAISSGGIGPAKTVEAQTDASGRQV